MKGATLAMSSSGKVVPFESLMSLCDQLREQGEVVVQAHGVFDVLHVGHLRHLRAARQLGSKLVVTITADRFVNKGPGRPLFTAQLRAEMLAALDTVDYVAVNDNANAVSAIEAIRPHVFAKGGEYVDPADDVTGQITVEKTAVERHGGRVEFTHDITFSSSTLINEAFDVHSPALAAYLRSARERGAPAQVAGILDQLSKLRVLFVGDAIVDEYAYVRPMGKSAKDNIIATHYLSEERFAGGVLAAANNVAEMCAAVDVLTMVGAHDPGEEAFRESLRPNVQLHVAVHPEGPTTTKRRYVDPVYTRKLFEIYFMDDRPLLREAQEAFELPAQQHDRQLRRRRRDRLRPWPDRALHAPDSRGAGAVPGRQHPDQQRKHRLQSGQQLPPRRPDLHRRARSAAGDA